MGQWGLGAKGRIPELRQTQQRMVSLCGQGAYMSLQRLPTLLLSRFTGQTPSPALPAGAGAHDSVQQSDRPRPSSQPSCPCVCLQGLEEGQTSA